MKRLSSLRKPYVLFSAKITCKDRINFGIYLSAKITCKDRIYFRIYLSAISDLNRKINAEVHPVFTSRKIKDELKAKEPKPPIVNQQNVVCSYFKKGCSCDL